LAFFDAVAGGYAARCAQDPKRFARINADQNPQAVRENVMAALRSKAFLSSAPSK
jgi:dTMP kinase